MHTPFPLLRFIGKAALHVLGAGQSGAFAADVLPDIARDAWEGWGQDRDDAARRAELEALAQAAAGELRQAVEETVAEIAADRSDEIRQKLTAFLLQVPPTVRHALRRPADPTGLTMPQGLELRQAEDLLAFLPVRLPRFRPGDRPLPGADWELVELVGVGGFGEVWKARHPNLASVRPAALKFYLDPAAAKVLRSEARLLDRVMVQGRHPGLVPLLQTYLDVDTPCLEYEYVAGADLTGVITDWPRRVGPTAVQSSRLILRLAEILSFAHQLVPPLVHRNLKPANILAQRGGNGKLVLRVADFGSGGVAASRAIRQTRRGTPAARRLVAALHGGDTPLYASPQQLRGADPDPRDDVYALGVLWYQLLTGDVRVGRPDGREWRARLEEQGLPRFLIEVLAGCLAEDADDRPASAAELRERLSGTRTHPSAVAPDDAAARSLSAADNGPPRVSNAIGMKLVLLPEGRFSMGSPSTETERDLDEGPVHEVVLTRPFLLGVYPVTQRQYEKLMGTNPSHFTHGRGGGPDYPVEKVSWEEAVEFCRRLSALPEESAAGRVYRLPTEAEWEYACRAGTTTPVTFGPSLSSRMANFNGRYPYGGAMKDRYLEQTTRVGSYPANAWGLYDMHGNVSEWCADWYEEKYYRQSPREDPRGPAQGTKKVARGGSCLSLGRFCRSAYRFGVLPTNRDLDVGFRVAATVGGR
jgi:formylglycine-generating enzyme required for sulfatase activity